MIEVAKAIGLDSEGQDGKQQMPRQVRSRRSLENALPPGTQPPEVEIAQFVLELAMRTSEVGDTTVAPPRPRSGQPPAGSSPKARTAPAASPATLRSQQKSSPTSSNLVARSHLMHGPGLEPGPFLRIQRIWSFPRELRGSGNTDLVLLSAATEIIERERAPRINAAPCSVATR